MPPPLLTMAFVGGEPILTVIPELLLMIVGWESSINVVANICCNLVQIDRAIRR